MGGNDRSAASKWESRNTERSSELFVLNTEYENKVEKEDLAED
jgi:hypothetical protein